MKTPFYLIILVLFTAFMANAKGKSSSFKLNVGDRVADYLGKDRQANKVLVSNAAGKILVISFWASWCGPCRRELPVLEGIQRQVDPDSLQVVAINYKESRKVFRQLKKKMRDYTLTITHDKNGTISRKFGVNGLPFMLILNRDGSVAYLHRGYGEDSIAQYVKELNGLLLAE